MNSCNVKSTERERERENHDSQNQFRTCKPGSSWVITRTKKKKKTYN